MTAFCPECFAPIEAIEAATHAYLPAPAGCWTKFNEVLTREYSDPQYWKAHRWTVDAYCAQHASGTDRRQVQSVAVHLVALYLGLEQHLDSAQIAHKMDTLIKRNKYRFPILEKPSFNGTLNVTSLLCATSAEEHYAISLEWAKSVWRMWRSEHHIIAQLAA